MKKLADLCPAYGWKALAVLFVAGALGALAMEPFALWPFLFVTLTIPVLMLDGLHRQRGMFSMRRLVLRAAALGWVWGLGYFTAGLWWLGKAFLVDPEFLWAMPLGVIGLPAALAFFPSLAFAAALSLWSQGARRILLFAAFLTLSEWLRGHLFSGFPWNVVGMALGNHLFSMQGAALVGIYGLTLATCIIGAAPAALVNGRRGLGFIGFAAALLGALAIYGFWRVPDAPQPTRVDVRLRLVQPNVQQDANFNADNGQTILDSYIALSKRNLPVEPPTHYIWPESAFPFLLHREPDALNRIANMLAPTQSALITGAARMGPPLPGEEVGTFYNAIQTIDSEGIIRDTYDKVHLVPFGEYVPDFAKAALRAVGLRQFVSYLPGGFTSGEARKPFFVRGLPPIAGSICYEAIFPGDIMPRDGERLGVIINVTNDAWFGDSPGPRQHLAQARLRAVEQGLPLIRAANSGISAVIDPYGRILGRLALNQAATLDTELPFPLDEPTPFSRWPNAPFLVLLLLCLLGGISGRGRTRLH